MKFWELVRQYSSLKFKIKSKLNEEMELRELCGFPHTGANEGMPKARNSGDEAIVNYIQKLFDLESERKELEEKLTGKRNNIMRFINNLHDYYGQQVVEKVLFRSAPKPNWKLIAEAVGYSKSWVRAIYKTKTLELEKLELEEINDEHI